MTKILVVDNYDSFVYTLNGYVQQLGAETDVVRNDAFPESEIADRIAEYDGVCCRPVRGPRGTPASPSPRCTQRSTRTRPCSVSASGTRRSRRPSAPRSPTPRNSCTARRRRSTTTTVLSFAGVPHPFTATRYHSLAIVDGTVPRRADRDRSDRRRRDHGRPAPREPGVRRAVPPGVRPDRGRLPMVGNWLETAVSPAPRSGRRVSPRSSGRPLVGEPSAPRPTGTWWSVAARSGARAPPGRSGGGPAIAGRPGRAAVTATGRRRLRRRRHPDRGSPGP